VLPRLPSQFSGRNQGFNKPCHIYTHLPHDFQPVTACWQTHGEINNWKK
jgi:hypothetical protein